MQLDAFARLEERARHPVGRETQQPAVSSRAASTRGLTFLVTVLSEVVVIWLGDL